MLWLLFFARVEVTTVFVNTRLSKTKHPRKRFQNFRQSYVLLTDRIEICQSQPASMTLRRSEGHTSGCDWWISIRSVSMAYKTDGNFGNVSAGVLFSKVTYQQKLVVITEVFIVTF